MVPRKPRQLAPWTLALLVALTGCQGTAPTTAPVAPTGTPAAPSSGAQMATGRIQLLDVQPGKPAEFITQPGKTLTVVASAASYSPTTPSFRLSVNGYAQAASSGAAGYQLASSEDEGGMPYSTRFTASTRQLLAERPAGGVALRRLAAVPEARELGSSEKFWVNTGDSRSSGDRERSATLKRKSPHAYFYVDAGAKPISDTNLDRLVSEFETKIYPRVTGVFGPVPNAGVDGDERLFIVISPAVDNFGAEKGLMGYFWSRDAIPNNSNDSHSNQKEALFMTDQLFDYPELTSFGTLAHEFQHLLNFTQKAARNHYTLAEETWLDEGLSMYAMEVAGYGLPAGDKHVAKDLNEFQTNPAAYSLTDWSSNPHGFSYGQSYLFVRYLVDRFGPGVIKEVLGTDRAGQQGLEQVLAKRQETFSSFFRAWTITNLISDQPMAQDTPYHYHNLPLTGDYGGFVLKGFQTTPASNVDLTADLRPWGTAYYTFNSEQQQAWRFSLGDAGATRLVGAAIVP